MFGNTTLYFKAYKIRLHETPVYLYPLSFLHNSASVACGVQHEQTAAYYPWEPMAIPTPRTPSHSYGQAGMITPDSYVNNADDKPGRTPYPGYCPSEMVTPTSTRHCSDGSLEAPKGTPYPCDCQSEMATPASCENYANDKPGSTPYPTYCRSYMITPTSYKKYDEERPSRSYSTYCQSEIVSRTTYEDVADEITYCQSEMVTPAAYETCGDNGEELTELTCYTQTEVVPSPGAYEYIEDDELVVTTEVFEFTAVESANVQDVEDETMSAISEAEPPLQRAPGALAAPLGSTPRRQTRRKFTVITRVRRIDFDQPEQSDSEFDFD